MAEAETDAQRHEEEAKQRQRELKAKLYAKHHRGERAQALLNDPLVKEAFEDLEAFIENGWKKSDANEEEVRERMYLMHRLYGNFKDYFETMVRQGRTATEGLIQMDEGKDPKQPKQGKHV